MVTIPLGSLVVVIVAAFIVGIAGMGAVTLACAQWRRWRKHQLIRAELRASAKKLDEILELEELYKMEARKDEDR